MDEKLGELLWGAIGWLLAIAACSLLIWVAVHGRTKD
jgi:hypothetical protein